MAAKRTARAVWQGNLAQGSGRLNVDSGATPELPVTWASRIERADGRTSPEELLAAAHASCFSMALSNILSGGGHVPERLEVTATCTLDKRDEGFRVTTMEIEVRARVPGIDAAAFEEATRKAREGCPISNAIRNNVEIIARGMLE